jgi:hypothetical protein
MNARDSAHQTAWELLPWYVNGTLSGRDLDVVTGHLANCAECADEVARCRDLAVAVVSGASTEPAPSAERLSRLLARIDAIEAASPRSGGWRERVGERLDGLRELLQSTPTAIRWALTLEGALAALLLAVVAWQLALSSGQSYHTLASGAAQPARDQAQIHLVFAEDMQEREMRALLERVGGHIVDGPSAVGAYTIAVAVPIAASDRLAEILSTLRTAPKVRLAEPIRSR